MEITNKNGFYIVTLNNDKRNCMLLDDNNKIKDGMKRGINYKVISSDVWRNIREEYDVEIRTWGVYKVEVLFKFKWSRIRSGSTAKSLFVHGNENVFDIVRNYLKEILDVEEFYQMFIVFIKDHGRVHDLMMPLEKLCKEVDGIITIVVDINEDIDMPNKNDDASLRVENLNHDQCVGLDNLGNTCFMNSGIQCLANCQLMSDFLINLSTNGTCNFNSDISSRKENYKTNNNVKYNINENINTDIKDNSIMNGNKNNSINSYNSMPSSSIYNNTSSNTSVYINEPNNNVLSDKAEVIKSLGYLLKTMRNNEYPAIRLFKKAIGRANSIYNRNDQQDSHEFISFILNIIHDETKCTDKCNYFLNKNANEEYLNGNSYESDDGYKSDDNISGSIKHTFESNEGCYNPTDNISETVENIDFYEISDLINSSNYSNKGNLAMNNKKVDSRDKTTKSNKNYKNDKSNITDKSNTTDKSNITDKSNTTDNNITDNNTTDNNTTDNNTTDNNTTDNNTTDNNTTDNNTTDNNTTDNNTTDNNTTDNNTTDNNTTDNNTTDNNTTDNNITDNNSNGCINGIYCRVYGGWAKKIINHNTKLIDDIKIEVTVIKKRNDENGHKISIPNDNIDNIIDDSTKSNIMSIPNDNIDNIIDDSTKSNIRSISNDNIDNIIDDSTKSNIMSISNDNIDNIRDDKIDDNRINKIDYSILKISNPYIMKILKESVNNSIYIKNADDLEKYNDSYEENNISYFESDIDNIYNLNDEIDNIYNDDIVDNRILINSRKNRFENTNEGINKDLYQNKNNEVVKTWDNLSNKVSIIQRNKINLKNENLSEDSLNVNNDGLCEDKTSLSECENDSKEDNGSEHIKNLNKHIDNSSEDKSILSEDKKSRGKKKLNEKEDKYIISTKFIDKKEKSRFNTENGEGEFVISKWKNFLMENNSVIGYNMYGLQMNIIECTKCKFTKYRFEPFSYLSLPVPPMCKYHPNIIFVRASTRAVRVFINEELTIHEILIQMKKKFGVDEFIKIGIKDGKLNFPKDNTNISHYDTLCFYEHDLEKIYFMVTITLKKFLCFKERIPVDFLIEIANDHPEMQSPKPTILSRCGCCKRDDERVCCDSNNKSENSQSDTGGGWCCGNLCFKTIQYHTKIIIWSLFRKLKIYFRAGTTLKDFENSVKLENPEPHSVLRMPFFKLHIKNTNILIDPDMLKNFPEDHRLEPSLEKCLSIYLKKEIVSIICSSCNNKFGTFTPKIVVLPNYLIIHLLRFSSLETKITTYINFPIETLKIGNAIYKLNSICNHINITDAKSIFGGVTNTISSGHYTAYVRKGNDWYYCNDKFINKTSKIDKQDAFILFYERINY